MDNDSPAYLQMSGSFADWTLADAEWYFSVLGWEFLVDGDTQRIHGIQ